MQFKTGMVVMVDMPEHGSTHTNGRACVVMGPVNKQGFVPMVPYSTHRDWRLPNLQVWPEGIGGRNLDGYLAPNMQGYVNPKRVYKVIGQLNTDWMEQVYEDLDCVTWKIMPRHYW